MFSSLNEQRYNLTAIIFCRSVGGIRVSLYNAITEEQVDKIVAYIREFIEGEQPTLPSEPIEGQ